MRPVNFILRPRCTHALAALVVMILLGAGCRQRCRGYLGNHNDCPDETLCYCDDPVNGVNLACVDESGVSKGRCLSRDEAADRLTKRKESDEPPRIPQGARGCGGYAAPSVGGCWYRVETHMSCFEWCKSHGGFDARAAPHVGVPVMSHFYPEATAVDSEDSPYERRERSLIFAANGRPARGTETGPSFSSFDEKVCACVE